MNGQLFIHIYREMSFEFYNFTWQVQHPVALGNKFTKS